MNKIDFHTHILPGMDDGARSVTESLAMLSRLREQGVQEVVLTPHYYSHRESLESFLQRRREAVDRLLAVQPEQCPALHLGCEVYLTDLLFNREDLTPLCIGGTRTMLVELSGRERSADAVLDRIARLASDYMVTPVLAHIERYPLCRSRKTVARLLDLGCVLQVNLESFTVYGRRRLFKWASQGCIGAIGTDAHGMTRRPPAYDAGYEQLQTALGSAVPADIQRTMKALLPHA